MLIKVYPLGVIPNSAGVALRVKDKSGKWHPASVGKGDSGSHYLRLPDGVAWDDLVGWTPIVNKEFEPCA